MELLEAIKMRRSCRRFRREEVPAGILRRLVCEAAIWAPTGGNAQAWRFGLVTDPALLEAITLVSPGLPARARAVIVICQDLTIARQRSRNFGNEEYALMDTAMAAQNLMLMAHSLGFGTCAVASFHRGGIKAALELPETLVPQLLVAVGYPAAVSVAPARNTQVWWCDRYGGQDLQGGRDGCGR